MQAIMWQVTPHIKLDQAFSLVKPSTLKTYTRFQMYADCYPLARTSAHYTSKEEYLNMNMDVDVKVDDNVELKIKPKTATLTSHFKVTKSNSNSFLSKKVVLKNQMMIPIQPRKGQDSSVKFI